MKNRKKSCPIKVSIPYIFIALVNLIHITTSLIHNTEALVSFNTEPLVLTLTNSPEDYTAISAACFAVAKTAIPLNIIQDEPIITPEAKKQLETELDRKVHALNEALTAWMSTAGTRPPLDVNAHVWKIDGSLMYIASTLNTIKNKYHLKMTDDFIKTVNKLQHEHVNVPTRKFSATETLGPIAASMRFYDTLRTIAKDPGHAHLKIPEIKQLTKILGDDEHDDGFEKIMAEDKIIEIAETMNALGLNLSKLKNNFVDRGIMYRLGRAGEVKIAVEKCHESLIALLELAKAVHAVDKDQKIPPSVFKMPEETTTDSFFTLTGSLDDMVIKALVALDMEALEKSVDDGNVNSVLANIVNAVVPEIGAISAKAKQNVLKLDSNLVLAKVSSLVVVLKKMNNIIRNNTKNTKSKLHKIAEDMDNMFKSMETLVILANKDAANAPEVKEAKKELNELKALVAHDSKPTKRDGNLGMWIGLSVAIVLIMSGGTYFFITY